MTRLQYAERSIGFCQHGAGELDADHMGAGHDHRRAGIIPNGFHSSATARPRGAISTQSGSMVAAASACRRGRPASSRQPASFAWVAATGCADVLGRQSGVLINNAAAFVGEMATAADLRVARAVIDAYLLGAWRMTQAVLPLLRKSEHPRVVIVSSGGSHADEQFGLTRRGGVAVDLRDLQGSDHAYGDARGRACRTRRSSSTPSVPASRPPGRAQSSGRATRRRGRRLGGRAATLPNYGPSGGVFRDGQPLGW